MRQLRRRSRAPTASEQRLLDAEPRLELADQMVLACWHALDSCRMPEQHTIGTATVTIRGPIPWTAIMEWARMEGLGSRESRIVADVIRSLDIERGERISSEIRSKMP